ncbi:putative UDPgalactose-glucose galactosyltransferase [hydrothermal vent metagenome]|uniref:Putative UDPgalactose-glucose galactosyltransferase n=1 Tax=hydrothermal vent metagenome TaxID=652676 RepID=A0A1W1CIG1_9ZZZZ
MKNSFTKKIDNLRRMILPSSKLVKDIDIAYSKCGTLKPISIAELSLIQPIKKELLSLRKKNQNIPIYRENKKLTLIVPYRNRKEHLKEFLPFIQKLLNEQKIDYEIIIAEQDDTLPFNRAKLMNIAVLHTAKESAYFIFHDVDALPYNVDYRFCNQTVKTFNYIKRELEYEEYPQTVFGGVTLVPKDIFYDINGFANNYWQWGKEDDDFLLRHLFKGYVPFYDTKGKLDMLPHPRALMTDSSGNHTTDKKILQQNKKLSDKNKQIFSKFKRGITSQEKDGINSVKDYKINGIIQADRVKTIKIAFD